MLDVPKLIVLSEEEKLAMQLGEVHVARKTSRGSTNSECC